MSGLPESPLLAILRAKDPGRVAHVLSVLREGGLRWAEVSLTTPAALSVVREFAPDAGRMAIGVGSVTTARDVEQAAAAGATFVVTPVHAPEALRESIAIGLPAVVGGFTPTELWTAQAQGAAAVKLFPAVAAGPGYLRALLQPLPHLRVVAVGGIDPESAVDYLSAGARAVGMGGPLIGDALSGDGDDDALVARLERVLASVTPEVA